LLKLHLHLQSLLGQLAIRRVDEAEGRKRVAVLLRRF
jgi:hypothetical protein